MAGKGRKFAESQRKTQQNLGVLNSKNSSRRVKKYNRILKSLDKNLLANERLFNRREESRNRIAEINRRYVTATQDVLNKQTLQYLVDHSKIDVPTVTSIFAGFELARSSRADKLNELRQFEIENIKRSDLNYAEKINAIKAYETNSAKLFSDISDEQSRDEKFTYSELNDAATDDLKRADRVNTDIRQSQLTTGRQNNQFNNQVKLAQLNNAADIQREVIKGQVGVEKERIKASQRAANNGTTYIGGSGGRTGVLDQLGNEVGSGTTDAQRLRSQQQDTTTNTSNGQQGVRTTNNRRAVNRRGSPVQQSGFKPRFGDRQVQFRDPSYAVLLDGEAYSKGTVSGDTDGFIGRFATENGLYRMRNQDGSEVLYNPNTNDAYSYQVVSQSNNPSIDDLRMTVSPSARSNDISFTEDEITQIRNSIEANKQKLANDELDNRQSVIDGAVDALGQQVAQVQNIVDESQQQQDYVPPVIPETQQQVVTTGVEQTPYDDEVRYNPDLLNDDDEEFV